MNRTIRITGKGSLSVRPDAIRLELEAEETCPEYTQTYRRCTEDTETIREAVRAAGFDAKDLKTTDFRITEQKECYRDKNGNYKNRFVGYQYVHRMYIRLDNDNLLLDRILRSLTSCGVELDFWIKYTVKDPDAVKNDLIVKAIADSRSKAELLANASGVTLGDVLYIDYSWGEIQIESPAVMSMKSEDGIPAESERPINIEADDLNVEDTVTVTWEIR